MHLSEVAAKPETCSQVIHPVLAGLSTALIVHLLYKVFIHCNVVDCECDYNLALKAHVTCLMEPSWHVVDTWHSHSIGYSEVTSVSLRMSGYLQIPMVLITDHLKHKWNKPIVGNVIFWITFCIIGQPLCIIMYYHDYRHGAVGPSV